MRRTINTLTGFVISLISFHDPCLTLDWILIGQWKWLLCTTVCPGTFSAA